MTYIIGEIVELNGRIMKCVPQYTNGAVYRKGAYFVYADVGEAVAGVTLSEKDLVYFRKVGEDLRKERGLLSRNAPVHISDAYEEDEILIGGWKWSFTKGVTAPIKEAGKDIKYTIKKTVGGVSGKIGEATGGLGGIKQSMQIIAVVVMLFIAAIIYIIFVKGKGAEGVSVSAVGK